MSIHSVCHGHLGKPAASRDIGKHRVVGFSMACSYGFGEKAVTTWVNVTLWGSVWDSLVPRLDKGVEVIVVGELYERAYVSKDNRPGKSLELKATNVRIVSKQGGTTSPAADDDSDQVPF